MVYLKSLIVLQSALFKQFAGNSIIKQKKFTLLKKTLIWNARKQAFMFVIYIFPLGFPFSNEVNLSLSLVWFYALR